MLCLCTYIYLRAHVVYTIFLLHSTLYTLHINPLITANETPHGRLGENVSQKIGRSHVQPAVMDEEWWWFGRINQNQISPPPHFPSPITKYHLVTDSLYYEVFQCLFKVQQGCIYDKRNRKKKNVVIQNLFFSDTLRPSISDPVHFSLHALSVREITRFF